MTADPLCCPVCRAQFRGARECSRCGADLAPLLALQARAHQARQDARQALRRADLKEALTRVELAERLCSTPQGRRLRLVTTWLASGT